MCDRPPTHIPGTCPPIDVGATSLYPTPSPVGGVPSVEEVAKCLRDALPGRMFQPDEPLDDDFYEQAGAVLALFSRALTLARGEGMEEAARVCERDSFNEWYELKKDYHLNYEGERVPGAFWRAARASCAAAIRSARAAGGKGA